jgi:NAD(P)-dependent dehydrogenase (short-subunit alcohol dehydrogenase family)
VGSLAGRVAVVTGGASGIGAASVRLFRDEGARVVCADVQDALGQALADELGPDVVYQHADVSREPDVRGLVERAASEWGRLDCMYNNAGIGGVSGPLEQTPLEEFDATLAVLLRGVFLGIKHAIPVMKRQGSGSIISTASVAGLRAGLGPHVYSACKAAVVQLTSSAALELGPFGIRVNCICPGGIVTPLITNALGGGAAVVEGVTQYFSQMQPIRKAGRPEHVARAALWLAGDASEFVTGQAIVVDGGLTAGRPGGPWSPAGAGPAASA